MTPQPIDVAVIGGGRWARALAAALGDVRPAPARIVLHAPSSAAAWPTWIGERAAPAAAPYRVAARLAEILDDATVEIAFVSRAARDHAATAIGALRAGKSVFVEKPFALSVAEAQAVVDAVPGGRICGTGLVLLHARNLRVFAAALSRLGPLHTLEIDWCDAAGEVRRGELKRVDASLSVVADAFPHLWSIMRMVDDAAELSPRDVRLAAGGRRVEIGLQLGAIAVTARLEREAAARRRRVAVGGAHGRAELDFDPEPGHASVAGTALDVATGFSSPLARQLEAFIAAHRGDAVLGPSGVARAIEAIAVVERLAPAYLAQQAAAIAGALPAGADAGTAAALRYAVREIVLGQLLNAERRADLVARWPPAALVDHAIGWLAGGELAAELAEPLSRCATLAAIRRRYAP